MIIRLIISNHDTGPKCGNLIVPQLGKFQLEFITTFYILFILSYFFFLSSFQTMARSFASQEEEIQFWKDKAAVLEKEAKEIKEEFQEFQEGSRELELELETQLEQSEGKIKEFRSTTNRLQHENEQLKDKLEQCHKEYHFQVNMGILHFP